MVISRFLYDEPGVRRAQLRVGPVVDSKA